MSTIWDIFNSDAFSLSSMTDAVEEVETVPEFLGKRNLFVPKHIRTKTVAVESRASGLSIIQTSQRGAPIPGRADDKRKVQNLNTSRIADSFRIEASELAFIRDFGDEQKVKSLQKEIARRLSGPGGLLENVEATKERMRLGCVQGEVKDADDTTIYNYFSEFGVSQSAEVAFNLAAAADGALRESIQKNVIRPMKRLAKGVRYSGIEALCGDDFFDLLIKAPEVRASYLQQQEASQLREGYDGESFKFGGVTWTNYVGDDGDADGSGSNAKVAMAGTKCRFIPQGSGGAFEVAYAPGETFDALSEEGKEIYVMIVPDRDRNMFVDVEVYSYPLFVAKRPKMLLRGKSGA